MIIGLMGNAGSGKDTVAAYLIKKWGFERKAFADPLKKSVAALFDIPFSEVDKLKLNPDILVEVGEFVNHDLSGQIESSFTFREILQRYGAESHRDIFGEDFWVDQTLPKDAYYAARKIVVTDVRFANELRRVEELGGITCRIVRDTAFGNQDQHRSEAELQDLQTHYIVSNNGTLEELYDKVELLLAHDPYPIS